MSVRFTDLEKAMGKSDGDLLIIQNKWARIEVTYRKEEDQFMVSGHTVDGHPRFFTLLSTAMGYVLDTLAEYERGRAD